jgi:hypothetical protein
VRLFAGLALALPFVAGAIESPVQDLKRRMEAPAEVLVLGTTHLGNVDGLTSSHVDGLVDALYRFAPKAVVVEALPAHTIEAMQLQADLHPEALDAFVGQRFLGLAVESQRQLKLDAKGARKALGEECTRALAVTAIASERCMRLAAAAWDKPWTDYLAWRHARQWPDHRPQGALDERVTLLAGSTNENELIGARLADHFRLPRVFGMDDHPGADVYGPVFDALLPAIGKSKAYAAFKANARVIKEVRERTDQALAAHDLLPLYRWVNSPEYSALTLDEEWRLFVDRDLPRGPGQARIALWDVRNLAMVSNILRVVSQHPGERVLVIVGVSHKPFFDDYLERSIGVRVRQLGEFSDDASRVTGTRGHQDRLTP